MNEEPTDRGSDYIYEGLRMDLPEPAKVEYEAQGQCVCWSWAPLEADRAAFGLSTSTPKPMYHSEQGAAQRPPQLLPSTANQKAANSLTDFLIYFYAAPQLGKGKRKVLIYVFCFQKISSLWLAEKLCCWHAKPPNLHKYLPALGRQHNMLHNHSGVFALNFCIGTNEASL